MRTERVLLAAAALVLAGCLGLDAPTLPPPSVGEALPFLTLGDATAAGTAPILRNASAPVDGARVPFAVEIPAGFWERNIGALEVSVFWDHRAELDLRIELFDATGSRVAAGRNGWFASVALLPAAASGAYEARITRAGGQGDYTLLVQVDATPKPTGPVRDLLPDVITLAPSELRIESPIFGGSEDAMKLAGVRGCGADEAAEQGARRCLRVSNRIGNLGEGALEVRLAPAAGVGSFADRGDWVQRVYRSDGSFHDEPVGGAAFHATHGHFHYEGLAHYQVYEYDLATKTRGDAVSQGKKSGFCFIDIGLVEPGALGTVLPVYDGRACADPTAATEPSWFMGLSPGWYDLYYWGLPEQYVEITGVPDGVYELVSRANALGTILESDSSNNEASVVFRLAGDSVDLLSS